MAHLDHFEGYPDLYQRNTIRICITSHNEHECSAEVSNSVRAKQKFIECNTYLLKNFDEDLLAQETFSSYDSSGSHRKPYRPE